MRRHSQSIAVAALAIFLAPGVGASQELSCGETLRRTIEQKFDFVSFNARKGEVVSITVAAVADPVQDLNFAPEFQVEDPDGELVAFTGALDNPRLCPSIVHQCETTTLPLDGIYTLIVNDNGKKQKGTYAVTLEAVSQEADGAWNGPPNASSPDAPACKRTSGSGKADGTQVVDLDTPVGGVIDDQGETDTFTFVSTVGQNVTIELNVVSATGVSFDPRTRLFDPTGQPVGGDCSKDGTCLRGPFTADGVYTIKVFEGEYTNTGEYTLTLRNPDATTTTTTTVTTTSTLTPGSTTTTTQRMTDVEPLYTLSRTLRRTAILTPAERLGTAIAADETRKLLVIGAPADQTFGRAAGAAFVMSIDGAPPQPSYGRLLKALFKPDGSSAEDRFGASVALLGATVVVGAPGADARTATSTVSGAGAVYLATTDGSFSPVITAPQPLPGSEFGATLAAIGSELFVGAPGHADIGRVYLVVDGQLRQEFDPAEAARVDPVAPARAGDRFGAAIAAQGDLLVIGAPADASREGRVFVYNRQSGRWSVLRSPNPAPGDRFGAALTFVDATLVIGAPGADKLFKALNADPQVVEFGPAGFDRLGESLAPVTGGLLVGAPGAGDFPSRGGLVLRLDLNGAPIDSYSKLVPEDGDDYGTAVTATADWVFAGVPGDDGGNVDGGAVYAYRIGVTVEEAIFRKRLIEADFARSLAADDERIAVGAPNDVGGLGAVYEFDAQPTPCAGGVCTALGAVAGGNPGARFGESVALADGAMLIGAPFEPADSGPDAGAAFIAMLGQSTRPKIANPEPRPLAGDQFGFSVAASEGDLLVGAPLLGDTDTGAVFVFDGAPPKRRLTLRNPVPTTGDFFGAAVAAEGETVAVGAPFDGAAAAKAGAVYLFQRATGELLEGKALVSPDARERELFGAAVAMSPDLIVVGAPSDDVAQVGRAYVFDRQTRGLLRPIDNPNRSGAGDRFGAAVAIIDGLVLVGAPFTDGARAMDSGAAYLFDPATGLRVQTFQNPPQGAYDHFGSAVAPAPSGFLIGAPGPGRAFVYRSVTAGGLAVRNALAPAVASGPRCGDGIVQGSEQCDDKNDVDTDDCRNDCTLRQCCVIDPLAADRCNDFDPCTDDSFDAVVGRCVNADTGQCCTSDASCAGADDVCRLCAGCSLYPWDCCDQGAACLLSSPECQGLDCFEKPLCECQGGLTCSDGSVPREGMDAADAAFLLGCDELRLEQDGTGGDSPVNAARAAAREARRAFKTARRETRAAYKGGEISKDCRKQYLATIKLARTSIPSNNKIRRCVNEKNATGG